MRDTGQVMRWMWVERQGELLVEQCETLAVMANVDRLAAGDDGGVNVGVRT